MSLPPPPKVQKLQEALHAKAKGSPGYRFYALYDKVYRKDILWWAYVRCRANDGAMRGMMSRLRLTVNEAKTRMRRVPEETFDFLGYTIGRCHAPRTGRAYLGTRPSAKVIQRLCREVSELTGLRWAWLSEAEQVARLNRKLEGWANYFCLGQVQKAYQAADRHTCHRLRQWLRSKYQSPTLGYSRYSNESLHERLGLVRLKGRKRNFPCAKA